MGEMAALEERDVFERAWGSEVRAMTDKIVTPDGTIEVRSGRHFCGPCARSLPYRPEEAYHV